LNRVWRLLADLQPLLRDDTAHKAVIGHADRGQRALELRRLTHRTIKKVTDDIEQEFQFNTAIAALMEFVNALYKFVAERGPARPDERSDRGSEQAVLQEAAETLVLLLAPFA